MQIAFFHIRLLKQQPLATVAKRRSKELRRGRLTRNCAVDILMEAELLAPQRAVQDGRPTTLRLITQAEHPSGARYDAARLPHCPAPHLALRKSQRMFAEATSTPSLMAAVPPNGLCYPRQFAMGFNAIPQVKIDQALIGNVHLVCH